MMTAEARRAKRALVQAGYDFERAPDFDRISRRALAAFRAVAPELGEEEELWDGAIKACVPGLLMSFGTRGVFSPFTFEAHVDPVLPPLDMPFTAVHELAHVAGFAREDEANFVGWLACARSEDPLFRYSGHVAALRHGQRALGWHDSLAFYEQLSGEEATGRTERDAFWRKRLSPTLHRARHISWDAALKAQGIGQGADSYDEMIELILAWYAAMLGR